MGKAFARQLESTRSQATRGETSEVGESGDGSISPDKAFHSVFIGYVGLAEFV